MNKQYKSITEVSELLKINKHVIRYWDSKFEGISTRLSDKKRRFFNENNIKKLIELKNVLYQNGKHNYSLDLAKKIIHKKSFSNQSPSVNKENPIKLNIKELEEVLVNLKKLL